jgi:DNA-binding HxlR family transcriptional regulator
MTLTRRENPICDCPLTAALAAMGGKWKLIIVYALAEAPMHLSGLRQALPSISQKVLIEQLRELIADDIVDRRQTGRVPAPVFYSLTNYGRTLIPLMDAARHWGRQHIRHFDAAGSHRLNGELSLAAGELPE